MGSQDCSGGDCNAMQEADTSALLQGRVKVKGATQHGTSVPKSIEDILASGIKDLALLEEDIQHPPALPETPSHSGAVSMGEHKIQGMSQNAMDGVKGILQEAAERDGDVAAAKVLDDLKKDDEDGKDETDDIQNKDYDEIKKAIEEVSAGASAEEQIKDGKPVVTSEMLNEVEGLPDTPEQAPGGTGKVVEGDMVADNPSAALLLLEASTKGKRFVSNLWEDNMHIPYCFAPDIAPTSKKAFQDAVQHWIDHVPCLGFKQVEVKTGTEKCATEPGIYVFSSSGGCFANVGAPYKWQGEYGASRCHLQPNGCDTLGVAAHELGHNIGMLHEQSRTDAADYVTILWDNIQESYKSQYTTSSAADRTVPYDPMSLMHYSDTAFGLPGKKTMVFKGESNKPMGNRMGLTYDDALQAAKMYKCEDSLKQFKLCSSSPDGCTKEACTCHQGSGLLKFTDGVCSQCLRQCPAYPSGTSGACGCAVGCEKYCFDSGGNTYCTCKDCTPQPEPTPAPPPEPTPAPQPAPNPTPEGGEPQPEPTPAPTPEPTPAPTPAPTATPPPTPAPTTTSDPADDGKCEDKWSFCGQYARHCNPYTKLNGMLIEVACPVTCDKCPGGSQQKEETSDPCADKAGYSCTCRAYQRLCPVGEQYKIGGTPFLEACKKTCDQCS